MSAEPTERERWHGTDGGYCNHACRCEDCTRAHAEAHLDYMHRHPEQQQKLRDYMWRSYVPAYARKRS